MARKRKDWTNEKVGMLTPLSIDGFYYSDKGKRKELIWLCQCDCGNNKRIRVKDLQKSSTTKSCGCLKLANAKKPRRPKGHVGFVSLYNQYRNSAKKRKLEFILTQDQFRYFTEKPCYYCGIEPYQIYIPGKNRSEESNRHGIYIYNGIDRMDNKQGYIENNCVPCCGICNQAKMDLDHDDFLELIGNIHRNRIRRLSLANTTFVNI